MNADLKIIKNVNMKHKEMNVYFKTTGNIIIFFK